MKRCLGFSGFLLLIAVHFIMSNVVKAQILDKEIYKQRRQKLMEKMDKGVVILRNAGRNSDFYYLTGLDELDAACLLFPGATNKFILFVHPAEPTQEIWIGKRPGLKEAGEVFGADEAYPIDQFDKILPGYLREKNKVCGSFRDKELITKIIGIVGNKPSDSPRQIVDLLPSIREMRLIKGPEEIRLMQKAVEITCDACLEAIKAVRPGIYEYEIQAIIEYIFRIRGSARSAFSPIIKSGPNFTILHYNTNNRQTQDGDPVVMDIGAEYGHYCADITRTIPVSGKFTREPRNIYEVVLTTQQRAIDLATPGRGIYEIHNAGVEAIKDGLYKLGLITDRTSKWQYQVWLNYNICHWIGLDVQDPASRGMDDGKGKKLEPGMFLTVEPGLYIRANSLDIMPETLAKIVPQEEIKEFINRVKPAVQKYAGIGVRIEDDVLITEGGHEILSAKIPKRMEDIERLMKKKSG